MKKLLAVGVAVVATAVGSVGAGAQLSTDAPMAMAYHPMQCYKLGVLARVVDDDYGRVIDWVGQSGAGR